MEMRKDDLRRMVAGVCIDAVKKTLPNWEVLLVQNGMFQLRAAMPNGSYRYFEVRVSEKY